MAMNHFLFLFYFALTTIFYYLAIQQGNNGVTFKILGGGDDGYFYWVEAKKVAVGDEAVLTSVYPLMIGYLFKITGIESPYLIRFFNFFGFIILYLISLQIIKLFQKVDQSISRVNSNDNLNSYILLTGCYFLYVSFVMNLNLSIIRDVWIYTVYLLSLMTSIIIMFCTRTNKMLYTFALLPCLWFLGELRGYALVSFILSIIIYLLYRRFFKSRKSVVLLLILCSFGFYYTFFIDLKIYYLNKSLRDALNYRHSAFIDSNGSQMWIQLDQGNFFSFILQYIHSYLGNMIGPLPWHITGMNTFIIFLFESIPMIFILMFIYSKRSLLSDPLKYTLLHAFVWFGLIAITNDNIGTATRLRAVGWIPILIVFTKLYTESKRKSNQLLTTGEWK